ncbi:MAG: nucleotidyltransferase domain-containing protein [Desulfotomaculales bacterium]
MNRVSPAQIKRIINEFGNQIKRRLGKNLLDIRLFGSVARGTFTPESDIDVLLVVQDESRQIRDAVIETAVEINLKHDVVIAPIIMSKDRYAGALFRETLFYKSLQEEGRPL